MILYYDRSGRPIYDTLKWARLFEDAEYKVVASEATKGGSYWVSTVWLGLDHSFWPHDSINPYPLIFETMVFDERPEKQTTSEWFPGRTFSPDMAQERYSTEAEALAGHNKLLLKYNLIESVTHMFNPQTVTTNTTTPQEPLTLEKMQQAIDSLPPLMLKPAVFTDRRGKPLALLQHGTGIIAIDRFMSLLKSSDKIMRVEGSAPPFSALHGIQLIKVKEWQLRQAVRLARRAATLQTA